MDKEDVAFLFCLSYQFQLKRMLINNGNCQQIILKTVRKKVQQKEYLGSKILQIKERTLKLKFGA